jgi:hypothetical protein
MNGNKNSLNGFILNNETDFLTNFKKHVTIQSNEKSIQISSVRVFN